MTKRAFPSDLGASWNAFHQIVRQKLQTKNQKQTVSGTLRLVRNLPTVLRENVEEVETSKEFSSFLNQVQTHVTAHGYHKKSHSSFWLHALRNALRRSGYYLRMANIGQLNSSNCLLRVMDAFARREKTVTYVAPMEYFGCAANELRCRAFSMERFSKDRLDILLETVQKEVFYPWAAIDTAALSQYWLLIVKEKRSIEPLGRIVFPESFGQVNPTYSPYPALERALRRLTLFDWQPDYGRGKKPEERPDWQGWLGFKVPFVIRLTDDVLTSPQAAPMMSSLATEPYFDPTTNEEIGEQPQRFITLCERETRALLSSIIETDRLIGTLESNPEGWAFLIRALGFLAKGFFSQGLEQLLWHITVLDALFGEDTPGITKRLARRTAAILASSEVEKKKIAKTFRKLYEFRSRLVHGDEFDDQVWESHLSDSRDMARRSLLWFLNLANNILLKTRNSSDRTIPNREELLSLVDVSPNTVSLLAKLMRSMPWTFPVVASWTDPPIEDTD